MHSLSKDLAVLPGIGAQQLGGPQGSSLADLEQSLQAALDVMEEFLVGMVLKLSPAKFERLAFWQPKQGVRKLEPLESLPIETKTKQG